MYALNRARTVRDVVLCCVVLCCVVLLHITANRNETDLDFNARSFTSPHLTSPQGKPHPRVSGDLETFLQGGRDHALFSCGTILGGKLRSTLRAGEESIDESINRPTTGLLCSSRRQTVGVRQEERTGDRRQTACLPAIATRRRRLLLLAACCC